MIHKISANKILGKRWREEGRQLWWHKIYICEQNFRKEVEWQMDDNYDGQWCAGVTLVDGENQTVTKRQSEYLWESCEWWKRQIINGDYGYLCAVKRNECGGRLQLSFFKKL